MDDNIIDAEKDFEIAALYREVEQLKNEIAKYKVILSELDDSFDVGIVSDTEAICIQQIAKLKDDSSHRELSTDETKKLDILHKNLKIAQDDRGKLEGKDKAGDLSKEELMKIIKGE